VSRAVDAHPDTETIPSENVEKLRTIGREKLYDNLQTLTQLRVEDPSENTSNPKADRLARAKKAVEKAAAGDAIAKSLFETTEVDRAKSQVLRFLNYKPRTRSELRKKLIDDKLYDPDVADEALDLVQEAGVQSDVDYAEQFGRMKWRTSKWAPAQIRSELKRKGMDERDAREGLSRVFGDDVNAVGESGGYVRRGTVFEVRQEARAMGTESADGDKSYELFLASRKRWALTDGMDSEKRRRRLIGWLQRRGHAFSLIQRIVDSLEAEDERAKYE
jgi:SOS response regulatory protein OraA/RecX